MFISGGRDRRRKIPILKACLSQISKRKMNVFSSLCCTIWLEGRGQLWQFSDDICLFPVADRARGLFCLVTAHCLKFLQPTSLLACTLLLSQVSVVLPFVNTLENIQSAAGASYYLSWSCVGWSPSWQTVLSHPSALSTALGRTVRGWGTSAH